MDYNHQSRSSSYQKLNKQGARESITDGGVRPPPPPPPLAHHITIPPPQHESPSYDNATIICQCCLTPITLFAFVLIAFPAYFFTFSKPHVPIYRVDGLNITTFDFHTSNSTTLRAEITARVSIENPNNDIEITYEKGSRLVSLYRGVTICTGTLPSFHQGQQNTTVVQVRMEGNSTISEALRDGLYEDEQNGMMSIEVLVAMPMTMQIMKWFKAHELTVNVICSVGSLMSNKKIEIKSDVECLPSLPSLG